MDENRGMCVGVVVAAAVAAAAALVAENHRKAYVGFDVDSC